MEKGLYLCLAEIQRPARKWTQTVVPALATLLYLYVCAKLVNGCGSRPCSARVWSGKTYPFPYVLIFNSMLTGLQNLSSNSKINHDLSNHPYNTRTLYSCFRFNLFPLFSSKTICLRFFFNSIFHLFFLSNRFIITIGPHKFYSSKLSSLIWKS